MNTFNHVNYACVIMEHFDITLSDSKRNTKLGIIIKFL